MTNICSFCKSEKEIAKTIIKKLKKLSLNSINEM